MQNFFLIQKKESWKNSNFPLKKKKTKNELKSNQMSEKFELEHFFCAIFFLYFCMFLQKKSYFLNHFLSFCTFHSLSLSVKLSFISVLHVDILCVTWEFMLTLLEKMNLHIFGFFVLCKMCN